jgi:hypothetical protein
MSEEYFIISVFCLIDDILKGLHLPPLRTRGFSPAMTDSEVITIEIVGEFLGRHEDKSIWSYFFTHWRHLFPNLSHRTTFLRQAANLWYVKQAIQSILADKLGAYDDNIHIADGFPLPVCAFRRANGSKLFKEHAAYGHCASKNMTYYGFQGLISIDFNGVISGITLTAANVDERDALWDIVNKMKGLLITDKGFIRPMLKQDLSEINIDLQYLVRNNMKDERPESFTDLLKSKRRLVETIIGQLAERFEIEKTKARDLWHVTNRIARKILSHTVGVFLNKMMGNPPLQLALLLKP